MAKSFSPMVSNYLSKLGGTLTTMKDERNAADGRFSAACWVLEGPCCAFPASLDLTAGGQSPKIRCFQPKNTVFTPFNADAVRMIFDGNYGNLPGVLTPDVGVDDRHLFATGMNIEQVNPRGKKKGN